MLNLTDFQPIIFDMDPFDGKTNLTTKYQISYSVGRRNSKKLNKCIWLLRRRGVLNSQSLFLSLQICCYSFLL